jgi:glycosyltransferase involved in cell wall biosynthesis
MVELSIIIPAYNEEKRIEDTIVSYLSHFKGYDCEILIVPNGCKDKTEEIVKNISKKSKKVKYKIIRNAVGKGEALKEGFRIAEGNLIGFVDADMSTKPKDFEDLIRNIKDNDCIIASRYIKGSVVNPKQKLTRIIASRVFNSLTRFLFGLKIHDTQCGAKLFKKHAIKKILPKLDITRWAFDVDLLYQIKKHNFKIKEYPTVWKDSMGSTLKIHKAVPEMLLSLTRLRLINSKLKFIVDFYDSLPESIKIYHKLR